MNRILNQLPLQDASNDDGDDEDTADGSNQISAANIKLLCEELLRARSSGYMHLVPVALIKSLLMVLMRRMETGQNKLLQEEELDVSRTNSQQLISVRHLGNCLVLYSEQSGILQHGHACMNINNHTLHRCQH